MPLVDAFTFSWLSACGVVSGFNGDLEKTVTGGAGWTELTNWRTNANSEVCILLVRPFLSWLLRHLINYSCTRTLASSTTSSDGSTPNKAATSCATPTCAWICLVALSRVCSLPWMPKRTPTTVSTLSRVTAGPPTHAPWWFLELCSSTRASLPASTFSPVMTTYSMLGQPAVSLVIGSTAILDSTRRKMATRFPLPFAVYHFWPRLTHIPSWGWGWSYGLDPCRLGVSALKLNRIFARAHK